MNVSRTISAAVLALATISALASDHSADYKVGTFTATDKVDDGNYSNGQGYGVSSKNASHNAHYVRVDGGVYIIESPTAVGKTIAIEMLTKRAMADLHKQWFMDQLHEGDQVLFASACDKHNNCTFWLPDPDKTTSEGKKVKEFKTQGAYQPDVARTNTTALCGKGKLAPDVEAKVCNAK